MTEVGGGTFFFVFFLNFSCKYAKLKDMSQENAFCNLIADILRKKLFHFIDFVDFRPKKGVF